MLGAQCALGVASAGQPFRSSQSLPADEAAAKKDEERSEAEKAQEEEKAKAKKELESKAEQVGMNEVNERMGDG